MQMRSQTTTNSRKWALIALIAAILAFLVGFGWQFMRARGLAGELEVAQRNAAFNGLEATLGAATIEAQRGSFEMARQHASDFFSGLQTDIALASETSTATLHQILRERDATITALSRSNEQSGTLLAEMFKRYRVAMGRSVGQEPPDPVIPPPLDTPPPADSQRDTTPPTTTTGS